MHIPSLLALRQALIQIGIVCDVGHRRPLASSRSQGKARQDCIGSQCIAFGGSAAMSSGWFFCV
jgi:hypothetical protein